MTKYVIVPTKIEAIQWDGTFEGGSAVREFLKEFWSKHVTVTVSVEYLRDEEIYRKLRVNSGTAGIGVRPGEWVVINDHRYEVLTDESFSQRYAKAEE